MAGNYPDVPGPRIPYDRDGSVGFRIFNGALTSPGGTDLVGGNSETGNFFTTNSAGTNNTYTVGVVLSVPFDLVGIYLSATLPQGNMEVSTNSTNGQDGTWTSIGTTASFNKSNSKDVIRTGITPVSVAGVKAIRFNHGQNAGFQSTRMFHLYGTPSAGAAPDRMRFWHPTSDVEVGGAFFDWGDAPRNAILTKTFRVKNPSALTAVDVTLTTEALTDTTPANVAQHKYSIGGGSFVSNLNIGNLSPGTISGVITVQRTVPSDAALSVWWVRMVASASTYV